MGFFGTPCFFYNPTYVGNLISGSSAFSKSSLNIWKFMVHASKVMLKFSKLGFNGMWTKNFQMYKLDLQKAEEPWSNCQYLLDRSISRGFQKKTSTSASLTMLKPLTVWIPINCGKLWKIWAYQTTLPATWETCLQVEKQQLEPDMEQQTASKSGKECVKAVYCTLLI